MIQQNFVTGTNLTRLVGRSCVLRWRDFRLVHQASSLGIISKRSKMLQGVGFDEPRER